MEERKDLYARRERFVDTYIAMYMSMNHDNTHADHIIELAVRAWDQVVSEGRKAMKDAGLLPFERVG